MAGALYPDALVTWLIVTDISLARLPFSEGFAPAASQMSNRLLSKLSPGVARTDCRKSARHDFSWKRQIRYRRAPGLIAERDDAARRLRRGPGACAEDALGLIVVNRARRRPMRLFGRHR
jgi:hypothetical protein